MEKILKRSEQDASNCWSVTDLFPGDEAWSAELEACQKLPEQLGAYRGRLGESAETLYDYLVLNESVNRRVESLFVYAFIRLDEEIGRASCRERV